MWTHLFLLIFVTFFLSTLSFKILLFNPKFGISHVSFTGKIADTLAAAGHDVVVYQPTLNENITFTGSKHESIRYFSTPRNFSYEPNFSMNLYDDIFEEESFSRMRTMMETWKRVKTGFCGLILDDKETMEKLREEDFDLGISEIFEACGFGVFKKMGLKKYITTFSTSIIPSTASLLGLKLHPSYVPGIMLATSTDKMTFLERVCNFLLYFLENGLISGTFNSGIEELIQKEFSDFTMNDAFADSAFYFVNSDEHIDYAQPITHKIIYMAGLGKVQSQPLQKEYTEIFNSAKKGVILFSFGSVVESSKMKPEMKKTFLEAFSEFPEINFIWKYEKDEDQIAKGYKNVFTEKWLPQNDILDHPKLLAFISHGGMNSVMEGLTKGIPMIVIPIFGDQKRNAVLLCHRETGIMIEKSKISKESIVAAIKKITDNESYRNNAKLLSKMVAAKPTNSVERVIKYAEFAAEFGDTGTLQTQGRYQSFWALYSIDVIAFLVTVVFVLIGALIWGFKKCLNFLKRKLLTTAEKKNK